MMFFDMSSFSLMVFYPLAILDFEILQQPLEYHTYAPLNPEIV